MQAGQMTYPTSDYMPNYQQQDYTNGNAAYAAYDNIANHDLRPLQPDPYDRYKNTAADATSFSQIYEHRRAQSAYQRHDLAPMAATMRYDDRLALEQARIQHQADQVAAAYQAQAQDEKAVGGVSATLDYDMDQMTEFVAEMAVGMYAIYMSRIRISDIDLVQSIKPGINPPTTFRKWVLQVLNATRLPSATILLSLSYLSLRVRGLSTAGRFMPTERSLYQMLTVALILGSKFLDDNTFQNKSWAEVSNISVMELNRDERDWLTTFGHRLHHDPNGPSGYVAWEAKWLTWQSRFMILPHPLDTSIHHQRSVRHSLSSANSLSQYSRHGSLAASRASEASYDTATISPYDSWHSQRSTHNGSSPSSAPYSSGPQTPEYYNKWTREAVASLQPQTHVQAPFGFAPLQTGFMPDLSAYSSSNNVPSYPTIGNMWNVHGAHCQCGNCRAMHPRYSTVAAA